MGVIRDDLDDHEGFAMRRLPDHTLTTTWSPATRAFTGYVAGCECGWHGQGEHPPTEAGEDQAIQEWSSHANLMLARQADRRRGALAQTLRALGGLAEVVGDPATLPRIARAAGRAQQLAADLARAADRPTPEREGGGHGR